MDKLLNVNHDQISVLHNLQGTDHISTKITATNLVEPALNSQRIAENHQYAITENMFTIKLHSMNQETTTHIFPFHDTSFHSQ